MGLTAIHKLHLIRHAAHTAQKQGDVVSFEIQLQQASRIRSIQPSFVQDRPHETTTPSFHLTPQGLQPHYLRPLIRPVGIRKPRLHVVEHLRARGPILRLIPPQRAVPVQVAVRGAREHRHAVHPGVHEAQLALVHGVHHPHLPHVPEELDPRHRLQVHLQPLVAKRPERGDPLVGRAGPGLPRGARLRPHASHARRPDLAYLRALVELPPDGEARGQRRVGDEADVAVLAEQGLRVPPPLGLLAVVYARARGHGGELAHAVAVVAEDAAVQHLEVLVGKLPEPRARRAKVAHERRLGVPGRRLQELPEPLGLENTDVTRFANAEVVTPPAQRPPVAAYDALGRTRHKLANSPRSLPEPVKVVVAEGRLESDEHGQRVVGQVARPALPQHLHPRVEPDVLVHGVEGALKRRQRQLVHEARRAGVEVVQLPAEDVPGPFAGGLGGALANGQLEPARGPLDEAGPVVALGEARKSAIHVR